MMMSTSLQVASNPGAKSAPGRALRLEKPSGACRLRGDHSKRERQANRKTREAAPGALCQCETEQRVPYWDGPRLKSAFVAQVLAQAMPQATSPSGAMAYRGTAAQIPAALLLDRNV
jgi:hypothetical protein